MNLSKKVEEWLVSSGGTLELRTAQKFKERGFQISQGYHYLDSTSNKIRETDIFAFTQRHVRAATSSDRQHLTVAVTLIIECKKTTKPWVGYIATDDNEENESAGFTLMMCDGMRDRISHHIASEFDSNQNIFSISETAYAIQHVSFSKDSNVTNHAYSAVQQVLSAAEMRLEAARTANEMGRIHITLPVIVMEGHLFKLRQTGDEFDLTETKEITLLLRNRSMGSDQQAASRLQIINSEVIGEYANRAYEFADWLGMVCQQTLRDRIR